MTGGIGLRAWWRGVGHDRAAVLAMASTALLASVFVSIAPRVVERASADDLRSAVAEATPEQRNLRFELRGRLSSSAPPDSFSYVELRGRQLFAERLPQSVSSIISDEQWLYDSPTFTVSSFPDMVRGPFPTTFRFRAQEGLDDQIALVRGSLPGVPEPIVRAEGTDCPADLADPPVLEPDPERDCEIVELQVFETAITEQTAADMMVDVGDEFTLTPDPSDTKWLSATFSAFEHRIVLRISGIVELTDPDLEYWYGDSSLHRPRITENADYRLVFAVGMLSEDRYRQFLRVHPGVDSDHTWRYFVDPDLITGDTAGQLALDLDKIEPEQGDLMTLLPEVLDGHLIQRTLAVQLVSMSVAGSAAVAVAAIAALGLLSATRRRATAALVIDRGASAPQVVWDSLRTGLLSTAPAAAVGWVIAWRWLPSTASRSSATLAMSFVVLAVVMYVLTQPRRSSAPRRADRTSAPSRRLLIEVVIVGLAIGTVLLLRRRDAAPERTDIGELDLLLAVAPALFAISCGIIAVRLFRPSVRFLARAGSRARGVSVFVGLRRLLDQPPGMRFPAVLMTMAASMATFSSVLSTSVGDAQTDASWQAVGADVRIESTIDGVPLPRSLDPTAFGEAATGAFGVRYGRRRVVGPSGVFGADIVALDVDAYRALLDRAGRPSAGLAPLGAASDASDASGAISAIRVGDWPSTGWPVGSTASVAFPTAPREVSIVATVDGLAGIPGDRATLLITRSSLAESFDERIAQPNLLLLVGVGGDAGDVDETIDALGLAARAVWRSDRYAAVAGDPLSTWTSRSLRALAGLGLLFALVGAVSTAVIGAEVRRRDLAVLRALGIRPSAERAMAALEPVPLVVLAVVVGIGSGIGAAHLLAPSLGLDAFAGGAVAVRTSVDPLPIGVLAAALAVGLQLVVVVSGRALDRRGSAKMLRVGDD